jgi:hypothetical protein
VQADGYIDRHIDRQTDALGGTWLHRVAPWAVGVQARWWTRA